MSAVARLLAKCEACSAPIFWSQTAMRSPVSLDAEPNPNGTMILLEDFEGQYAAVSSYQSGDVVRYTAHRNTCAKASLERRPYSPPRLREITDEGERARVRGRFR